MDFTQLDQQLRDSLQDLKLDQTERNELRQLGEDLRPDQIRYLRNRAFELVRELVRNQPTEADPALKWLEQVVRTLETSTFQVPDVASACFSPGESCRRKIIDMCAAARVSADICVFTISDDRITDAIIDCHRRGVAVRVISDDDKQYDAGSDIGRLKAAGIPLQLDCTPTFHMHHKFALFDGKWLLNGSFNWTRGATEQNAENLLTSNNAILLSAYQGEFDRLWRVYASCPL